MQQKTKIKQRKSSPNNADRKYGWEDEDADEEEDVDEDAVEEEDVSRKKLSSCLFNLDTNWKTLRASAKWKVEMKLLKFPLGFPRLARVRAHKSFAQIIDNLWVMAKLRSVQSAWNALPSPPSPAHIPWSFALAKQCSMNRPSKLRVEIEIKQLATQCVGGGGGEGGELPRGLVVSALSESLITAGCCKRFKLRDGH